jgi:putative tryptophan/tyrosine transport system substrate-binding protein
MRDTLNEAAAAARTLRVQLRFVEMQGPDDLERAFSAIAGERPDALLVFPSAMLYTERTHCRAARETPPTLGVQQ